MLERIEKCFCCGSEKQVRLNVKSIENPELRDKMELGGDPAWCMCCDCGFVFQNPRKPWNHLEQFYINSEYREFDEEVVQASLNFAPQHLVRFDKWLLACDFDLRKLHGVNCLDFGCGYGGSLQFAVNQGCKAYGVELDQRIAAIGQQAFQIDIVSSLEELPPSIPFEMIFSNHTLEHVYDPNFFFDFCASRLSPSGYLVLAFPAWRYANVESTLNGFDSVEYSKWDYISLSRILNRYGFYMVSHAFQNYGPGGDWELVAIAIRSNQKNSFAFSLEQSLEELYVNIKERCDTKVESEPVRMEHHSVFHGKPLSI